MALDREWFTVELSDGTSVEHSRGAPKKYLNREEALAAARKLAASRSEPLTVVRYTKQAVRTVERRITLAEADVALPGPPIV